MTVLERADGFKTASRQQCGVRYGKYAEPTRDRRPSRACINECAVTMEIQWLARKDARSATSLSNEERDGRSLEVGGTHISEELW